MSKHELIDDYISQRISRRMFIQGLTALGVSSGIAASYAVALKPVPGTAAASVCDLYSFYSDFYELYCMNPDGNNTGGSQPDGSQGGTGPTDVGQGEEDHKKKKRRKRKGNKKKKKH